MKVSRPFNASCMSHSYPYPEPAGEILAYVSETVQTHRHRTLLGLMSRVYFIHSMNYMYKVYTVLDSPI